MQKWIRFIQLLSNWLLFRKIDLKCSLNYLMQFIFLLVNDWTSLTFILVKYCIRLSSLKPLHESQLLQLCWFVKFFMTNIHCFVLTFMLFKLWVHSYFQLYFLHSISSLFVFIFQCCIHVDQFTGCRCWTGWQWKRGSWLSSIGH